jgi:hypothetical protein
MRRMASRAELLVKTIAARPDPIGKTRRLLAAVLAFADLREVDARLERLREAGIIERVPGRWQLAAGIVDMLRFWVFPSAGSYYDEQEISFAFSHFLRFVEEPASIVDPVGLFTSKDGIIGHLLQTVHDNPQYDFQLLRMWSDGVDELARAIDDVLAGTHPRAKAIRLLVEEPDYHERLRSYLQRWREDPSLVFRRGPDTASDVERTFSTVTAAVRYFNRLPDDARRAVRHVTTTKTFPTHLAEPRPKP